MPLSTGARLGPYEILSPLGAGGMGEVYKARDTRLDRSVAIKVLAPEIAGDPDLLARFEREARAVAALDHPHICGIYDVGEANGTHFIVMPHLDGQTLAARLEKGPLPLDQTLKIATEIADALDKAHRQGITHRDLKPANIMLTKAGSKLLDFGLAKLKAPAGAISMSGVTRLATATPQTARGTILGTVQYMAPEQVEGKEADARSDIWALGAVIYEMATGTRPFKGDTPASVIGSILKDEPPPIATRQPLVPRALDHLIGVCLAKDPDGRWQSAHDIKLQLHNVRDSFSSTPAAPLRRSNARERLAWAVAIVSLVAAVFVSRFNVAGSKADPPHVRFSVPPPEKGTFTSGVATVPATELALSPDGRQLAFVAAVGSEPALLWVQRLDSTTSVPLPGTAGADSPFWAPDSQSIGFFAGGKLKRVGVTGQLPQILCDAPEPRGGTWNKNGDIVFGFSNTAPLFRISESGGTPTTVTTLDTANKETSHRYPNFLPNGRNFLYRVRGESAHAGVYLASLDSSGVRRLLDSRWAAVYASPGYLLFGAAGDLFAQPFDARNLQLVGAPVRVAQHVGASSGDYVPVSASDNGVLAYGGTTTVPTRLTWYDRSGRAQQALTEPGDFINFALSPDETRVAFSRVDPVQNGPDLWVLDLKGGVPSRFTFDTGLETHAVWSPDGSRIIFRSFRNGVGELYEKRSAGGAEEILVTPGPDKASTDWSSDGKWLLYQQPSETAATLYDLWMVNLSEKTSRPFLQTPFNEMQGKLSPNGRFIAYTSDESGRLEVYVRNVPDSGGKWQVSTDGGSEPSWRADGRELFYVRADRKLVAVPVSLTSSFEAGAPQALFEMTIPALSTPFRSNYAAARNGQRFLINTVVQGASPPPVTILLNWTAALKK